MINNHHYRHDLRELAQLRETIDSIAMIEGILPQQLSWTRERVRLRLYERKLLYKEIVGREYKSEEELRKQIDGGTI